jgi:aryl-alcohol dehydrogenase-like predicted oxidoreductase
MTSLDSYITLGRSGLRVSPLSLGTMTFGEDNGWGASPETSEAILAEYLDRGGNVVDTANTYTNGHSEKIVGGFFSARRGLRERAVLSTKFFANSTPATPTAAAPAARHSSPSSRSRCGACRPTTLTFTGCTAGIAAPRSRRPCERSTTWSPPARSATSASPTCRHGRRAGPDDRPLPRLDAGHCAAARVLGPGAHTRGRAAADGRSARRGRAAVESAARRPPDGEVLPRRRRAADSRRGGLTGGPTEQGWVVIDAVAQVAAQIGVGSAEVALAWVRSRPAVTSTLIGARTVEQLRTNLASLEITLTPEQLAALDALGDHSGVHQNSPHE